MNPDLQYDIHQRYTHLAELMRAVRGERTLRVLDLGAGPSRLTEDYLGDGFEIVRSDCESFGDDSIVVIPAGHSMPFAEDSFDVVLALDVLEHVDKSMREDLLRECARVARDLVLLTFPRDGDDVRAAETTLGAMFHGGNDFLEEHAAFGLPDIPATCDVLGASGFRHHAVLDSTDLDHWLLYTAVDAMLVDACGPGAAKDAFNRAINERDAVGYAEGAHYRVFVCATRDADVLERIGNADRAIRSDARPEDATEAVVTALATMRASYGERIHDVHAAKDRQYAELAEHATGLTQQAQAMTDVIETLKQTTQELRAELEASRAANEQRDGRIAALEAELAQPVWRRILKRRSSAG